MAHVRDTAAGARTVRYMLESTGCAVLTVSTMAVASALSARADTTAGVHFPVAPMTAPAAGGPIADPTAADV